MLKSLENFLQTVNHKYPKTPTTKVMTWKGKASSGYGALKVIDLGIPSTSEFYKDWIEFKVIGKLGIYVPPPKLASYKSKDISLP